MHRRQRLLLLLGIWIATALPALAMDYSVPYVRNGLSYGGCSGLGAIVGELEVRDLSDPNQEYNGIDGFDGHRHLLLGPDPGDPLYGLVGFQDVKDFTGMNNPADQNFHGTFVAGIMAGQYASLNTGSSTLPFTGVAPDARYYGAVFDGADTKQAFLSLNDSLNYLTKVAGASVINASWGATGTSAAYLDGKSFATSVLMDEYVGYAGKKAGTTGAYLDKLMVVAAGNNGQDVGPTNGLLSSPADAYNVLSVGALNVGNPNTTELTDPTRSPAANVAPYSSWRPLADGRAGVDVVAPGTSIWSALAIDVTGTNGLIAGAADGTSFAAPHVTGVAAILYGMATGAQLTGDETTGYGIVTYSDTWTQKGTLVSTDHKLMKALLINSAEKIPGLDANGNAQSTWQPGQVVLTNGVPNAIVPLNYAVGAGSVDANEAVMQYVETGNRFWDMKALRVTGGEDYYTFGLGKFTPNSPEQVFLTGLTATLVWDRHVDFTVDTSLSSSSMGEVTKDLMSNLDLILQREVAPGVWEDVYMSAGTLDNVEHIYFKPVVTGTDVVYRLVVRATDIAADADTEEEGESYALAVSFTTSAVPEPGMLGFVITGLIGIAVWRIRRKGRPAPAAR